MSRRIFSDTTSTADIGQQKTVKDRIALQKEKFSKSLINLCETRDLSCQLTDPTKRELRILRKKIKEVLHYSKEYIKQGYRNSDEKTKIENDLRGETDLETFWNDCKKLYSHTSILLENWSPSSKFLPGEMQIKDDKSLSEFMDRAEELTTKVCDHLQDLRGSSYRLMEADKDRLAELRREGWKLMEKRIAFLSYGKFLKPSKLRKGIGELLKMVKKREADNLQSREIPAEYYGWAYEEFHKSTDLLKDWSRESSTFPEGVKSDGELQSFIKETEERFARVRICYEAFDQPADEGKEYFAEKFASELYNVADSFAEKYNKFAGIWHKFTLNDAFREELKELVDFYIDNVSVGQIGLTEWPFLERFNEASKVLNKAWEAPSSSDS